MSNRMNVDTDTELLTAYLDNELTTQERLDLERRLVDDRQLREQLRQLRRAWDLLEELPDTNVSRDFTTTTLKLVAKSIEQEVLPPKRSYFSKVTFSSITGALLDLRVLVPCALIAVAFGIFSGLSSRATRKDELMRVIAAATILPAMKDFDDWSLAERLMDFPLLNELAQTDIARNTLPIPPKPLEELPEWLESLDPRDKEILRNREDDMWRMDPETRQAYLDRYDELSRRDDALPLQRSATVFASLLDSIETNKRAGILNAPAEEQVKRIREEACFRVAMWYADHFKTNDHAVVKNWTLNELRPSIPGASPGRSGAIEQIRDWRWRRGMNDSFALLNEVELFDSLTAELSPKAQDMLYGVAPKLQIDVLSTWALYSLDAPWAVHPTDEELVAQYKLLSDEQKEKIDFTDANRAQWQLRSELSSRTRGPGSGSPRKRGSNDRDR